jgi:hypothetical protein
MTLTAYEIPLQATPQHMRIALNGNNLQLTFYYRSVDQGGWTVDIADSSGKPILSGIPLVTGADLLAQYAYLQFGGALWVQTSSDPNAVPTFENLGTDGKLYWVVNPP